MDPMVENDEVLSVEFFTATDQSKVMMAVPSKCGLKQADTLRVDGLSMVAMRERSILPIDMPELTDNTRNLLLMLIETDNRIAVGEILPRGLFDSYWLKLVVV